MRFIGALLTIFYGSLSLADLTGDLSQFLYESTRPRPCPQASTEEMKNLCSDSRGTAKNLTKDIDALVEKTFFENGAQKEVHNITCKRMQIENLLSNDSILSQVTDDFVKKAPMMKELYHEIQDLKKQKQQAQSITGGFDHHPPPRMVQMRLDKIREVDQKLEQILPLYAMLLESMPLGRFPEGQALIENVLENNISEEKFRKSQNQGPYSIKAALEAQQIKLTNEGLDLAKYTSYRPHLEIDRNTKENLFRKGHPETWFVNPEDESSQGLLCRMDARYGAGKKDLDSVILMGSFALGGSGMLLKLGLIPELGALALAQKSKLLVSTARLLVAGGNLLSGAAVLEQVSSQCIKKSKEGLAPLRNADCDPEAFTSIQAAEEQNCILAAAFAALPAKIYLLSKPSFRANLVGLGRTFKADKFSAVELKSMRQNVEIRSRKALNTAIPTGQNTVSVGITTGKGIPHYYLKAGSMRYDGEALYFKSVLNTGARTGFSKGVIFQMNVPEATFKKVIAAIEKRGTSRNISCVHGACKILEEADIVIGDATGPIRLKTVTAGLFKKEIKIAGDTLSPEQIQTLATSNKALSTALSEAENGETVFRRFATGYIVVITGGAYVMYQIVDSVISDD